MHVKKIQIGNHIVNKSSTTGDKVIPISVTVSSIVIARLLFKQNLPDDLPPEWQAIFESLADVMDILALFEEDAICT